MALLKFENKVLFKTFGNKEEGGHDKPVVGGLSNKAYDGVTFSKLTESGKNLFVSKPTVDGDNLTWPIATGKSIPNLLRDGNTICTEIYFKNTKYITDQARGCHFYIGGRNFSVGFDTNQNHMCLGASMGNTTQPTVIFVKSGWSKVTAWPYDFYYTSDSLVRDAIYKINNELKLIDAEQHIIESTSYVNDDKVFTVRFAYESLSNYVGTMFNHFRALVFGNIIVHYKR